MSKPRVLLADDHVLVSAAFKKLLEPVADVVFRHSKAVQHGGGRQGVPRIE